jgi:cysteine-rich repeat protein
MAARIKRTLLGILLALASGFAVALGCAAGDDESAPGATGGGAGVGGEAGSDASIGGVSAGGVGGGTGGAAGEAGADAGSDAPASVCGNREVEPDEECDDGNLDDGDGCSSSCRFEPTGPDDVCPGETLELTPAGPDTLVASVTSSTAQSRHQYSSNCGGGSSPDNVYTILSAVTGRAFARLVPEYEAALSVRSDCADPRSEIACDTNALSATLKELRLEFPVFAGSPVSLLIDGYAGQSGGFLLEVEIRAAYCGNGRAESPEECDDGNLIAGDGCSPSCKLESIGPLDICPGRPIRMFGSDPTQPRTMSVAGDTSLLANDFSFIGGCTNYQQGDAVYEVTTDIAGSLVLSLQAEFFAMVGVRSECGKAEHRVDCNSGNPLTTIPLSVPVEPKSAVYVVVDSNFRGGGKYTLDLTVVPAACGNGLLETGEECDDGNSAGGDGCTAECKLEPRDPAIDHCPGVPLALSPDAAGAYAARLTGSNVGLTNDFVQCASINTLSGPDAIYALTSPIDGYLTASVSGNFDTGISLRSGCAQPDASTEQLACDRDGEGRSPRVIKLPVTKDQTSYLVIDGVGSSLDQPPMEGTYLLEVSIAPSVCGNKLIEGGEACDDGNTTDGDGCDQLCRLEPKSGNSCDEPEPLVLLGDGSGSYSAQISSGTTNLDNIHTRCGTLFRNGRDKFYSVTPPAAGVLSMRLEPVGFDGVLVWRDVCATDGVPLACVTDGLAGAAEELSVAVEAEKTYFLIVDGTSGMGPFSLKASLRPPGCGDSFKVSPEECDDGNLVSGDGCSATCRLESLNGVDICPGFPLALAGTADEPRTAAITVGTAGLKANDAGSCGGSGPDGVLRIDAPISGTLSATVKADFAARLFLRSACGDAASELACSATAISQDVLAGRTYYLFVDGYAASSGVAEVGVRIDPP